MFNRYLDSTADDEGLAVLPLMVSVRAGTRAFAVAGSSLRRTDPDERRHLAAAARDLMSTALALLDPATPRLIAIGGGTQSQRSALAAGLAPRFDPAPGARIVQDGNVDAVLAAGYTAIFHRSFETSGERQRLADVAAAGNAAFAGLWLGAAPDAPATWHALDLDHGAEAATADALRLIGAAAPRG